MSDLFGNWFSVEEPTEDLRACLRKNAIDSGADPRSVRLVEEKTEHGWRMTWRAQSRNVVDFNG